MKVGFDIASDQIDGARDYQEDAYMVNQLGESEAGDLCSLIIMADEEAFRKAVWQRFMRWASKYRYLLEHEAELGENLYLLRYEDLIAEPEKHMNVVFNMLGLETPELALEIFGHKVASTEKHEHKAMLVDRIQGFQRKCVHPELREVCARMGYEHLA